MIRIRIAQVAVRPVHWLAFGGEHLKARAISPDAFCQAALQASERRGRYMCPHTSIYVSSYYYMCPHTTLYVSSYFYVFVLVLLYVSSY